MNIQQHSHIPVDIKSTSTLIPLPNRTRVVSVCVCGRFGFGWQRSRHGSHQVVACLPSEDEGSENKQKERKMRREPREH